MGRNAPGAERSSHWREEYHGDVPEAGTRIAQKQTRHAYVVGAFWMLLGCDTPTTPTLYYLGDALSLCVGERVYVLIFCG